MSRTGDGYILRMAGSDTKMASGLQVNFQIASPSPNTTRFSSSNTTHINTSFKPKPSSFLSGEMGADVCAIMVCYIWFAESFALQRDYENDFRVHDSASNHDSAVTKGRRGMHRSTASSGQAGVLDFINPSRVQLCPTDKFISFVTRVLTTTQVSDSVIKLCLYYIYRLKVRHNGLQGETGSEYRLFLTSLIMANKFLDDYTFTNKTWAEITNMSLHEITKMEAQLFLGIDNNASVSLATYNWWCCTLDMLKQKRDIDAQWLKWQECAPSAYPSSPISMTCSASSSPATTPLLTPQNVSFRHPHLPKLQVPSELQCSNNRKRSLPTDPSDLDEVGRTRYCPNARTYLHPSPYATSQCVGQPTVAFSSPITNAFPWQGFSQAESNTGTFDGDIMKRQRASPTTLLKPSMNYGPVQCHSALGSMHANESMPMMNVRSNVYGNVYNFPLRESELCWPMSSWSPPCGNYGLSSSPLHLEYYQVAAGYSYGIPAIMTVPPTSSQVLNTHLPLPSNPSYVNPGHMIPHGLQVPSHMTSNINQVMPSSLQWPLTSYSDRGYDLSTVGKT